MTDMGKFLDTPKSDVDAVILWVNGSDPVLRAKRQMYESNANVHISALEHTRFADTGEIYFCIASILKFAPWFRNIWIVTDNQRPAHIDEFANEGLACGTNISIVDHRVIFRDHLKYLPTFNSPSIETLIWNIPGLAERFVYFNDDFFLNSNTSVETFFDGERPKIRGRWKSNEFKGLQKRTLKLATTLGFKPRLKRQGYGNAQRLSSWIAGFYMWFYNVDHIPHPQRRSDLQTFFQAAPNLLETQLKHRFRHQDQFISWSLAYHIAIKSGDAILLPEEHPLSPSADNPMLSEIGNESFKFGCVQSLDKWPAYLQIEFKRRLIDLLSDKIPTRAKHDLLHGFQPDRP